MTTPFPEMKISSYVLAVSDANTRGEWMNVLTAARSNQTIYIPRGTSTCSFSNTSEHPITIKPRVVYDTSNVVFLPEQEVPPGRSAVFKVSNPSVCYLSIIQQSWGFPRGRFGLEVITMPPVAA